MEPVVKSGVTVANVAERAGVSRAAVYAVLNSQRKLNIGVSEKTRLKIREAIDELGYSPNDSARGLISGKTHNVGLLLTSPDSLLSLRLMEAVNEVFSAKGFMVISDYSQNDPEREREKLETFLRKRVDCLILSRLSQQGNGELVARYAQYGIPVIVVGQEVAFDEPGVMETIAEQLISKKRHRLFYIGYSDRRPFANQERLRFLTEAAGRHPELTLAGDAAAGSSADCRKIAAALAKLPKEERPEALVCYNDRIANQMVVSLQLAGFRVPEEIGVVGIDGYPDAFDHLKLSGVRLPVNRMARALWKHFSAPGTAEEKIFIAPEWINGSTL